MGRRVTRASAGSFRHSAFPGVVRPDLSDHIERLLLARLAAWATAVARQASEAAALDEAGSRILAPPVALLARAPGPQAAIELAPWGPSGVLVPQVVLPSVALDMVTRALSKAAPGVAAQSQVPLSVPPSMLPAAVELLQLALHARGFLSPASSAATARAGPPPAR